MEFSSAEATCAAHLQATNLATASAFPAALKCAIELDLLEHIKRGGPNSLASPAELAAKVAPANPAAGAMIDRILRLLASYSVVNCLPDGGSERRYALGPVCEFLTKNADGVSLASLFLLCHSSLYQSSWGKLKDAIVDGGVPFHKTHGRGLYEHIGLEHATKLFSEAMSSDSTIVMKKLLQVYKGFEGLNSVVDVGGGIGATMNMIVSKYPALKGINLDLPHSIQRAPFYSGVEHVVGDMFVKVPKGDAIFLKWVIHNWADEQCVKLLRNCYDAIPVDGKVIVVEIVLPEGPDYTGAATQNALHMDLMMLSFTQGGKERTESEFEALAMAAGFRRLVKVCRACNYSIMELSKK